MGPFAVFALLAASSCSAMDVDFSTKEWKERPITKVVGLLKDMATQLQKEADGDEDMYSKLGCWCAANDKEKTKAIADENQHINDLTSAIEGYTAKGAQLETEIEKLNAGIEKSTEALAQATEIRKTENAQFQDDENDMMSSGAQLKGAVESLGQAHGAALTQKSLLQVKKVLGHHMMRHKAMFNGLSKGQHRTLVSLLQSDSENQDEASEASYERYFPEYAPQSGAIFGILKQMKETFETNLKSSQTDESQAASEYGSLKNAKERELKGATDLSASKSVELADTGSKNAEAKQDLADTNKQLAADTKFLESVKGKCATADAEYQARLKVRTEEIEAVSQTIGILTNDDAQASFSRSSFIQMSSRTRRMSSSDRDRAQVASMLRKAGMKSKDAQLVKLASSMQMDGFTEVKAAIDTMINELKKTQKQEVEQKNYCDSEIKQNDKSRANGLAHKAELDQSIADSTSLSERLADEIKALQDSIHSTQVEMKSAGQQRERENADFQVTVQDQRATQAILAKAVDRLKAFYNRQSLSQTSSNQTPPAQGTYKKSGGGSGAVILIEGILKESADIEAKAMHGENESQAAYEGFISDSNASIDAATQGVVSKQQSQAKADSSKIDAQGDLRHTVGEILSLGEYSVALHGDCDFFIKNYDTRQSARADEIDALANAKAIFSGANFGGFLQK